MSTYKRLKRCADILWNKYDDEIKEHRDWFYALRTWEINFSLEDDCESVVAYRRKNGKTDWSDYVILSQRIREWREIV